MCAIQEIIFQAGGQLDSTVKGMCNQEIKAKRPNFFFLFVNKMIMQWSILSEWTPFRKPRFDPNHETFLKHGIKNIR